MMSARSSGANITTFRQPSSSPERESGPRPSITVAATLALLGFQGAISAPLLLSFTFALGVGMALQVPTWQSLIPEVVRREEIGAAARLDMISVNVARAVGPVGADLVALLDRLRGVPVAAREAPPEARRVDGPEDLRVLEALTGPPRG